MVAGTRLGEVFGTKQVVMAVGGVTQALALPAVSRVLMANSASIGSIQYRVRVAVTKTFKFMGIRAT